MKISYKGDYALKAMLDLALHYNVDLVSSHDMAERIDAPIKFLEQVLLELRKGGFIESRRGNVGGYMLSREPGKITIGEVIRHIEGPIEPIACVKEGYSNCVDINKCVLKKIWSKVYRATAEIIDNVTFEQLVSEIHSNNQISAYSI
jgi:Rrf2 family cysteine metabolism transcriptional repressor